jgi:hypothetical protein
MPLLGSASRARRITEQLLRGAAAAMLLAALYRVFTATSADAERRFERWTSLPTPAVRDALAAARRAGREVEWRGDLPDLAIAAEPARQPGDRWQLAAVAGRATSISDALGVLDSLPAGGGTLLTRSPREAWRIREFRGEAGALPGARRPLGRVLVIARAGWEAKFTIAALEEDGWSVDARLSLGAQMVTQGDPRPRNDRHAAVVLLDSSGTDVDAIARYVRAGGGLVLSGEAAAWRPEALRALIPARSTTAHEAETREFTDEPLHALSLFALERLQADALVLETREALNAVAARRERAGRVVQSGYAETWRWRMQGEEGAMRAHRLWWSALVGAAAGEIAPRTEAVVVASSNVAALATAPSGAPLAELVHALGPASEESRRSTRRSADLPLWLGALLLTVLVAEWGSRRARGAA